VRTQGARGARASNLPERGPALCNQILVVAAIERGDHGNGRNGDRVLGGDHAGTGLLANAGRIFTTH
jgi:hypothetical protein